MVSMVLAFVGAVFLRCNAMAITGANLEQQLPAGWWPL
jgi:hypothetical protein